MIKQKKYDEFTKLMAKVADLSAAGSVLAWDQETYMPKKGGEFRARQIATLQTMAHELFVSDETGKLIKAAMTEDLSEDQKVNLLMVQKDYEKKKKYPIAFVEEMANATASGFNFWHEARTKNDFSLFAPLLEKIVELKRQEARIVGFENHPYDALMDDYEPGLTIAKMEEVFNEVKRDLFPFMKQVIAKHKLRADFIYRKFEKDQQWKFSEKIIRKMGYDFDGGRGDFAPHPFCTTFGPGDVRITLRASENHFNELFFSATHEVGHALYEQGLPMKEHYGLPMGSALSMAFHESQSRFWENNITRSYSFWKGEFAELQKLFPESLSDVSAVEFYRGVNLVEPSLIRVEADVSNILEIVGADKRTGEQFHSTPTVASSLPSIAKRTIKSYTPGDKADGSGCFSCGDPHPWAKKINGKWVIMCPKKDQPGVLSVQSWPSHSFSHAGRRRPGRPRSVITLIPLTMMTSLNRLKNASSFKLVVAVGLHLT